MINEQQENRFDQPRKQWIKAVFWCVAYVLFITWVGNYFWLIGLPFVFDAFITKYIPWTWWKKSENKAFLAVMGWIDAIVFALVAVYFINTFFFQNYQIPTSSLEKSLLVGDFLFVSKASYGPRVPNTPFSFPLVQHTFPILNTKSYIETPHWDYKRLKGFDTIAHNDIVVFNFPTGDTVAVNVQNPDYYSSCYYEGLSQLRNENPNKVSTYDEIMAAGRAIVRSNTQKYGEIVYRPVDRRENYVKRCVGLPGDRIQIKNNQLYINNRKQEDIPGLQFNYFVQTDGTQLNKVLDKLEISLEDRMTIDNMLYAEGIKSLGFNPELPLYHMPLTNAAFEKLRATAGVTSIKIEESSAGDVFPLGDNKGWTRDNFGPLYIPRKGAVLILNNFNFPLYERIIRVYENNSLQVRDGKFYLNGKETKSYQFKMDYYWMMGDNRHNSADSRYWGLVPEDHIVGRPVLVWLSLNKDKNWLNGKIRFNRFFKNAER
ncbi:MAG: S26 family signal peptidase [Porphyromonadaceae bacterium CG2_30_38_12]|nr:MAG: S26 family signal peptidase [Porphyromonadaceae bacterium CG2_30_38_12]